MKDESLPLKATRDKRLMLQILRLYEIAVHDINGLRNVK